MRGTFCSRLARYIDGLPVSWRSLYDGYVSTLEYMVDSPLEDILGRNFLSGRKSRRP